MNINSLLAMGIEEASAYDGRFNGDTKSGYFNISTLGGNFTGTYIVNANLIEVVFSNKPFFVPCSIIESFLKSHIK